MNRPQWQPTELATPAEDPLPWLTDSWGPEADVPRPAWMNTQEALDAALAAAQKSLNTFVIGLTDDDTSYRLVLGKSSSTPAMTAYEEHTVFLGTKPWTHFLEGKLTFGQLVSVFTGLAYHEVGHVRFDRQDAENMRTWMRSTYSNDTVHSIAGAANNVARDLRLEAEMQQQWPGFAEALRVAMWWVSTAFGKQVTSIDTSSVAKRMAAFTAGSRYPWEPDWTGHESLRDEWLDWAARCETAATLSDFQSLTVEATERILGEADEDDGSEPDEPGTEPGGDEGDEPGPDGPSGSEPPEGEPSDDTEGEPSDDAEGEGEPEDDAEGEGDDGTEGDEKEDFSGPTMPDDTKGDTEGEPDDAEGDEDEGEPSKDGDPTDGQSDDSLKPDETEGQDEATFDHDAETTVDRSSADDSEHGGWNADDVEDIDDIQKTMLGCASKMAEDIDDVKRQDAVSGHAASQRTNKSMSFTYEAAGKTRKRTIVEMRLDKHADEVYRPKVDARFETEASAQLSYTTRGEYGYKRTNDDAAASQQLAAVMASSRKGPGAPEFAQRTGRVDRRRVSRLAFGESRIFQKPDAAAPQRVNIGILIDASGSMSYGDEDGYGGRSEVPNIEKAAQVGRNLASAVERLPWARGFVAAHTTGYGGTSSGPIYIPIWTSGEPTVYLDDVLTINLSGNEDGFAVAFAAEHILSDLKRDEKGLLIVISDGAPAYAEGETHTRTVVDSYRKRGIRIVSVAISAALRLETQEHMYGSDEVIAYNKNASAFAQSMARVIGSSI